MGATLLATLAALLATLATLLATLVDRDRPVAATVSAFWWPTEPGFDLRGRLVIRPVNQQSEIL